MSRLINTTTMAVDGNDAGEWYVAESGERRRSPCGAMSSELDGANFRRSVLAEDGWVVATGRRARPGSTGGKPAGALSSRADVEARRADPVPAANPEEEREPVRAVVHDSYGPPAGPSLSVSATRSDSGLRSAEYSISRFFTGLIRPKRRIVGLELSGEVEAVGDAVTEFRAGDHVFGIRSGANADFVCIRESGVLAHIPAGMTFEEAAAVADGAISAMSCLRNADVRKGRKILVYGASGSIGTAAVQLARYYDAHVTAVCNTKNVELVRSLGADEVIDYLQEDFTKNGRTYDIVFDAVGKHSFRRCRRVLKPGGMYISTGSRRRARRTARRPAGNERPRHDSR